MQLFLAHIDGQKFQLDAAEVNHCVRVLRKKTGDQIFFISGDGNLYEGTIQLITKSVVGGSYKISQKSWGAVPYELTVAIAPTKMMDRMDWFVEKAVEMGVSHIIPILCDRSERKVVKQDKLEKKVLSAVKQSLKGKLPKISPMVHFDRALEEAQGAVAIAHCEQTERMAWPAFFQQNSGPLTIFIGPEGDFSPNEILRAQEAGAHSVHLGGSRLRTETAAIAAVAMVYGHHLGE
jgi:16S rRNA (uracil1498-N3)-methyltransferase